MPLDQLSAASNIRIFIIITLFFLVGFDITSVIIILSNYRESGLKSTLATLILFTALLAMDVSLIFGFSARIKTETPAQVKLILITIALFFVLRLGASINFMLVLFCKPIRRFVSNVRRLFYE